MLAKQLKKYNIILGSASPRRKKLLTDIGLKFTIKTTEKEENYPINFPHIEIAEFLAKQKSDFLSDDLKNDDLLITADTIVSQDGKILHKPKDKKDAKKILTKLSGNSHKVITAVCIKTTKKTVIFSTVTKVFFNILSDEEMDFYITNFNPLDKAGAYGIQEWIGLIGIEKIEGSYYNVVGLPIAKLYHKLIQFV